MSAAKAASFPTAEEHALAEVAQAAGELEEALEARNAAVAAAVAAGLSQRKVAEAAGLTHPGVAKILARR